MGNRIYSIPCRASYFEPGRFKEYDECILFFISSWCKIDSVARNRINYVFQTFSNDLCLLFCVNPSSMVKAYLKLDMTQTATVNSPDGWSTSRLAPSSVPVHSRRHSSVSCSSADHTTWPINMASRQLLNLRHFIFLFLASFSRYFIRLASVILTVFCM